ncbi:MAG TPA: alkaline phosphatase family protein [Chitinophagaceae bacterium]|nr:alkaline phosphatase family protein [Chitinophagaceae bacterium]
MKNLWTCIILLMMVRPTYQDEVQTKSHFTATPGRNIVVITIDGFRWQEVFAGADSLLINNEDYTPDAETMKSLYWDASPQQRRIKLMPFFWNVLAAKGQLFGNRELNNKVNVANAYAISYPGYNEILTGGTDLMVASNAKELNPNINVLEYLNATNDFKDKVAVFTSWDVFPFILNKERSGLQMNSGYEDIRDADSSLQEHLINKVQDEAVNEKDATRFDALTFLAAKEYISRHHPKLLYLGLGETDEFAHRGRYDLYLQQATEVDRMIAELWHCMQTTPGYRDNTDFIITTDHGRGSKTSKWSHHGAFIKGSTQTWLALLGPDFTATGEMKNRDQLYEAQVAQTIAALSGHEFITDHKVAPAVSLR